MWTSNAHGAPVISSDAYSSYARLKPLIISLACETGFYVLSFAVSTYLLARKGFKTRAILIMWITTFIMFAASTCHLVLQWSGILDGLRTELGGGSFEPSFGIQVASFVNIYLPVINYSLSDGIVLWRVWIMWGRSMKVLLVTVLFSLGSVGASVFIPFDGFIAIYASTLINNVIATMLIVVKAWQHRRLLKSHLNNTQYRSQALSVRALLVESGTLYYVIWIIFLVARCSVFSRFTITATSVLTILPGITVQVSGIYPTAVIALAALQRTTWDMSVGKDMSQNAPHTEMRFVTRDTRSGTATTQTGHPTLSVDEGPHAPEGQVMGGDAYP